MTEQAAESRPATVSETTQQAGEAQPSAGIRARWDWVEPTVWTERMLTALETGVKGGKWFRLMDKVYALPNLRQAFARVKANEGAAGVDHVTVEEFERDLEANLAKLSHALADQSYRPQAVRRKWINKLGSKEQRPLGISTVRDRVVQASLRAVLEPIFERDFAAQSYGFRPKRGCKDELRRVDSLLKQGYAWVVDADLKSYFDKLQHDWLVKFVEHRIGDRRIVRLIQKWLKAGVMEEGRWLETEMGTPQGAVISPLLANIYLHYVFDVWVHVWREKCARGDVIVVRYADDTVLGFQHLEEADRFLANLRERLAKFGLELHPDKTRRIEFGRYAEANRKQRGEGKPETFDFLGFTHISGKNRRGYYTVKRRTIAKRLRAKLQELKQQLRRRRHDPVASTGQWLRSVVQGYFNYHAVPGNLDSLGTFRERLKRLWRGQLLKRSQRHRRRPSRLAWLVDRWLPRPRVLHPWPSQRFAASHPR